MYSYVFKKICIVIGLSALSGCGKVGNVQPQEPQKEVFYPRPYPPPTCDCE